MISRCSDARERTVNRSEWSSETTTVDTTAGYRRTRATSIDAMRTVFLAGTGDIRLLCRPDFVRDDWCAAATAAMYQHAFHKQILDEGLVRRRREILCQS
jgi:hypothetical protein